MQRLTKFKSSIPPDMRVFEHDIVAEVNERHYAAIKFVNRHKRRIYLEGITDDKGKPKAIRLIGKSKGWFFERSKCIGYLPANIATKLIRANVQTKVIAQLQMIVVYDKHTLNIRFDILGPTDNFETYSSTH
jgi:hypothetical protein